MCVMYLPALNTGWSTKFSLHCLEFTKNCCSSLRSPHVVKWVFSLFDSNFQGLNLYLCPVHLPRQNIFCTRQNIFCTGQNNFCPKLKSTFLLVKWMENNFLAMEKNFSTAWNHFLPFSQANMNFLVWDKNFCPGQKCFV